jgi:hypothetical protein
VRWAEIAPKAPALVTEIGSSVFAVSLPAEESMQKQTLSHNLCFLHFVQDFDAPASLTQTRNDREQPYRAAHEEIPSQETEFTTEWQMVSPSEAVYSS